ncbi:MAG: EF-hand domain-containing protein [Alphaproteobacteria bacterium]|nr:EF-hand domain-containing protein [Alphaproteobacteria bacterium]
MAEVDSENQMDIMDFDINDDKKISQNELSEMLAGLQHPSAGFTDAQKEKLSTELTVKFAEADTNNDGYLDADECKILEKALSTLLLTFQFEKLDRNHDGVINFNDVPPLEESMKKLENATQKLEEVNEKLKNTSTDEMANNFISSFSTSLAKEEYFGMDKNKDGCVNVEEYVAYNLQNQNDSEDIAYKMSRKDFIRVYAMTKKKAPNCMTAEDYLADSQKTTEQILNMSNEDVSNDKDLETVDEIADNPNYSKEFAEIVFTEMDVNHDGKVTREEFVAYEIKNENSTLKEKDYQAMFNAIFDIEPDAENAAVDKQQFIAGY